MTQLYASSSGISSRNWSNLGSRDSYSPKDLSSLVADLNSRMHRFRNKNQFEIDKKTGALVGINKNGKRIVLFDPRRSSDIEGIRFGTETSPDGTSKETKLILTRKNGKKAGKVSLHSFSESSDNVLTYKQFTNQYREIVEKHASEVSPKNMYQLYLLGKVKKLIK